MNLFVQNSIAAISQFIPLKLLMNRKQFPPFLPFYHIVSDIKPDYIDRYAVRSQKQFETELDYLLKHFEPVGLNEILHSPAENKMHLSFDDGLKECSSVIVPILKKKGIPATFFISPDFVDNRQLFHRFKRAILESKGILEPGKRKYFIHEVKELDELAKKNKINFSDWKPYLTTEEITGLQNDGFSIGAHSMNHPEMWTLSEEEQYLQVKDSMQWVVDRFHPEIKAFSFPFTDHGLKYSLFDRLKANGIVDVTFGTAGLKYDNHSLNLQRIPVELKQNRNIQKVVHFEYFYHFLRSLVGRNRVIH